MSDDPETAVVLPLGGTPMAADPWRMLAQGDAALLTSSPSPGTGTTWGPALRGSSALGKQLAQAASQIPQAVSASGKRYVLRMPPGHGQSELMSAVGGGFRAMVAGPGGKVQGHAKLLPLGPKAMIGAIGSVGLGLLALTVVSEMLGGDEQAQTLAAIEKGVERLNVRFELEDDAKLRTAEQTIRQAHAALLDGALIPESIGLGSAMTDLQVIRNRSEMLLSGWERVVADLPPQTSGDGLREALGGVGSIGWDSFGSAVRTAYRAIALDSRRIMLTAAEAQLRNPGSPLSAFRTAVAGDLDARSQDLNRLRAVFSRLATTPLTVSGWSAGVLPHWVSGSGDENGRTQAMFAGMAAALSPQAAPSAEELDTITVDSRPDGGLQLVRPS